MNNLVDLLGIEGRLWMIEQGADPSGAQLVQPANIKNYMNSRFQHQTESRPAGILYVVGDYRTKNADVGFYGTDIALAFSNSSVNISRVSAVDPMLTILGYRIFMGENDNTMVVTGYNGTLVVKEITEAAHFPYQDNDSAVEQFWREVAKEFGLRVVEGNYSDKSVNATLDGRDYSFQTKRGVYNLRAKPFESEIPSEGSPGVVVARYSDRIEIDTPRKNIRQLLQVMRELTN